MLHVDEVLLLDFLGGVRQRPHSQQYFLALHTKSLHCHRGHKNRRFRGLLGRHRRGAVRELRLQSWEHGSGPPNAQRHVRQELGRRNESHGAPREDHQIGADFVGERCARA